MALRDQPYLPLYIQDYLTDEKLACCSFATQGVYIRIMLCLHKSEAYGGILYMQNPKQNLSMLEFFAFVLSRQTGVDIQTMKESIDELLFYKVLRIGEVEGVPFLFQKRMVEDFKLSEVRSKAARSGGKNSDLHMQNASKTQAKPSAKHEQNPEYEYEYEYEDKEGIEEKEGMGEREGKGEGDDHLFSDSSEFYPFDEFWSDYDKKVGDKEKLRRKWNKLPLADRRLIKAFIPLYKRSEPNKKYRKNPETFLNNKSWNDELIDNNKPKQSGSDYQQRRNSVANLKSLAVAILTGDSVPERP